MLTLGVPTLRRYDLLETLFATAMAGDVPPDRFVVVDNGGGLGDRSWMPKDRTTVIVPGRNLGVSGGWNAIIRESEDMLVIAGDDVRLDPNTLSAMVSKAEATDADLVWPEPTFPNCQMFSCFLFRKRLVSKVGWFDESFYPAYFEDNDYHYRMKLAGAKVERACCKYFHFQSGTLKSFSDSEKSRHDTQFDANRLRYTKKWGGGPGREIFQTPYNK